MAGQIRELTDDAAWWRELARALLAGEADTDDVVRTVARALLATGGETARGTAARAPARAADHGGAAGPDPDVAGSAERDRSLRSLGACAMVEALEYRGYHRPIDAPLLQVALDAIDYLRDALAAEGPRAWRHYARD